MGTAYGMTNDSVHGRKKLQVRSGQVRVFNVHIQIKLL